jgi:enamine deaminase RidA (YjgF/YER057c/UK114 family)
MIRALSLAAALAVLPLSSALAGEMPRDPDGASQAAIEAAASAFEARMEGFGERAEAVSSDESLSADQREARIAAIWAEYAPEVSAFTAEITRHAGSIAQQALANIDVEALVADALNDPEVHGALAAAAGMAQNGAWAANDPEQQVTYGLIAQYALDQAAEAVSDADADVTDTTGD